VRKAPSSPVTPVVEHDDIMYPSAIPFVLVHLACIAVFWTGVTSKALAVCLVLYWLRIFAIGAGYHRYFSHRAYRTSRVFQFILAFLSQSSAQKSVLWWAAKHRHHHLNSDTQTDIHSPHHKGLMYSHLGWIFARSNELLIWSKSLTSLAIRSWCGCTRTSKCQRLCLLCCVTRSEAGPA
jgi:stearoyl-CoA desaturase (Delta-9 desaturase)